MRTLVEYSAEATATETCLLLPRSHVFFTIFFGEGGARWKTENVLSYPFKKRGSANLDAKWRIRDPFYPENFQRYPSVRDNCTSSRGCYITA